MTYQLQIPVRRCGPAGDVAVASSSVALRPAGNVAVASASAALRPAGGVGLGGGSVQCGGGCSSRNKLVRRLPWLLTLAVVLMQSKWTCQLNLRKQTQHMQMFTTSFLPYTSTESANYRSSAWSSLGLPSVVIIQYSVVDANTASEACVEDGFASKNIWKF